MARTTTTSKVPRKRTSIAKQDESDYSDTENTPVKKSKPSPSTAATRRKRKAPAKEVIRSIPIARSFSLCNEADKMLIEWKESGKTWEEIRAQWTKMTGDETAASTLPNRYSRLKDHFVVIKEEDNAVLLECKQEIEGKFEREKWDAISALMVAKGADVYKGDDLERQYRKLLEFGVELKEEREEMARAAQREYEEDGDEMEED